MGGPVADGRGSEILCDRATLFAILAHLDEFLLGVRDDGTVTFASPTVRAIMGYDPQSLVGRNIIELIHPDEQAEAVEAMLRWSSRPGTPEGQVHRVRTPPGEWISLYYDVVSGSDFGGLGQFVLTVRHATDADPTRTAVMQQLHNEERMVRLATAFVRASVGGFEAGLEQAVIELAGLSWVTRLSVWVLVEDRFFVRTQWSSRQGAPTVALPHAVTATHLPWARTHHEVHGEAIGQLVPEWGEATAAASDGDDGPPRAAVEFLAVPMVNRGRITGFILIESTARQGQFDTTHFTAMRTATAVIAEALARHEAELELEDRARNDRLTRLPNRWSFRQALDEALIDLRQGNATGLGVALIDLDRFKVVNDSLGHDAGDRLLVDVAERFTTAARALDPDAVVARLGGDEFLLLHPDCPTPRRATAAAVALLTSLEPPLSVAGHPVTITASAGVVHAHDHSADAVELMRRADLAMYRAKDRGGDCAMSDDALVRTRVAERVHEEAALRQAIEGDGLEVYLQGEWDLRSDRLLGAEALARWRHPAKGVLSAAEFIPLAEETGLVTQLGRRVLRESCTALAEWHRLGMARDFVLRVNLSAQQLRDPDLVADVAEVLSDTGVSASSLCMELTESTLLSDPGGAAATLHKIRELGVGLSVDDFGTGYSSLLYLKSLPLTSLKVDRAFVSGLPDNSSDYAIVSAVVQLAGAFGVGVTAEGVETTEQRDALLELQCHDAQGYLLSRPEPIGAFAERLVGVGD